MSPDRRYPLELDQTEVERYRTMAAAARQAEADLWEPAGIVPGARVADVGCGPGAMLPALAAAVGPDGRVTAVDTDPQAVTAATALVAAAGLGNVAVRQGRAEQTGLEAGSLDVVMLRHVLAHNGGAEDAIVAHLATLLRPSGCLYLVDTDATAIRVIPRSSTLTWLTCRSGTSPSTPPGAMTTRPAWAAREAMVAAGMATAEDLRRWDRAFEATARRPATFFAPMFAAIGRRPAQRDQAEPGSSAAPAVGGVTSTDASVDQA